MMENKGTKIMMITIATVITFAFGVNISGFHRTPHVIMNGSDGIINENALSNFKHGSNLTNKIKVSTFDGLNYILTRKKSIIHVDIFNDEDEFSEEITCGKLDYYYEPYSYASERVQLQNCSPGQEVYDLGAIRL